MMKLSPKAKNILEWTYCIIIAVTIAFLVKYFLGTPTTVKQTSMYDTLVEGDKLWLARWTRTVKGEYKRGDIITFEAPSRTSDRISANADLSNPIAIYTYEPTNIFSKFIYYVVEINKISYIKRIIGVEGDHIKIENGKVYLNEKLLEEDYLEEDITTEGRTFYDIIVPEGYVFVMGDNRPDSVDSRKLGCIPLNKIEGKVLFRIWPLNKLGKV